MARVTGPLMSMDASGSIAGSIVFSRWKGRPYVRRHAIPSNPQTDNQVAVRAIMRFLAQEWLALSPTIGPGWAAAALPLKISGFNLYCGYNARRWRENLPPTQVQPPAGLVTLASAATLALTAGVRHISLSITKGANGPDWAWAIYRASGSMSTPTTLQCRFVIPYTGSPMSFADGPLTTGDDWYYQVRGLNSDGGFGAFSNEPHTTVG